MQVIERAADLQTHGRPVAGAIGIFDGVHLGHRELLRLIIEDARAQGGMAVAITFDRHPNVVVAPDRAPAPIQTLEHRVQLFESFGLDATLVIPFDLAFSRIPADQFIRDLVRDFGRLRFLAIGQGFTFGYRRGGNVALLETLGRDLGFTTRALEPVCLDGVPIRSTRIRELITSGNLTEAGRMLGRPYSILGKVLRGDGFGRQLGFPTANLDTAGLLQPPLGVYAARARVAGASHPAVLNLGRRPTLGLPNPRLCCEVHLLEFTGDLYGQTLEVVPGPRLRDERKFPSLDDLRDQIARDVVDARAAQSIGNGSL